MPDPNEERHLARMRVALEYLEEAFPETRIALFLWSNAVGAPPPRIASNATRLRLLTAMEAWVRQERPASDALVAFPSEHAQHLTVRQERILQALEGETMRSAVTLLALSAAILAGQGAASAEEANAAYSEFMELFLIAEGTAGAMWLDRQAGGNAAGT